MGITVENRITSTEAKEAIYNAHNGGNLSTTDKATLAKLDGIESSGSEIDGSVSSNYVDMDITSSNVEISYFGNRKNIWQYTEDLSQNRYSVLTGKTIKTGIKKTIKGITFEKTENTDFYGSVRSQIDGLNLSIFEVGKRYLASCYIFNDVKNEDFIWQRVLTSSSYATGSRLIDNNIRRQWFLLEATAPDKLTTVTHTPEIELGQDTNSDLYWYQIGSSTARDIWIGGFQIEEVNGSYIDGIALIGDSTMAGSSGKVDYSISREVSRYLEAELRTNVFNRAVGGETLADMDARWAIDITPLKANSKYAIIQGGINDISQGRTFEDIKASFESMNTKALADGFIPVFLNCTPTSSIGTNEAKETIRNQVNEWLTTRFSNVVDIAKVVANPLISSQLNEYNNWHGDGTHYTGGFKRLIALHIAEQPFWDFIKPSPYQKIEVNTWNGGGGLTAATGTELKGSFDADTATATEAAQRVLALENILRDSGLID